MPLATIVRFEDAEQRFAGRQAFMAHLHKLGLTDLKVRPDPVQIATEAALWGSIAEQGLLDGTVIVSDGAGQFRIAEHGRLYFSAPSPGEGEADTDSRILELMKSNRAQRGLKLCLRWKNGVFVPEGTGENAARKMEIGVAADEMFLKLLDERNSQRRHVSDRPGNQFCPQNF